MIGHLGHRVSALLDGQLSTKEADEAWAHVYACHACRDLVEREGWVKTRLAGLGDGDRSVPSDLKGSLLNLPPGEAVLVDHGAHRVHRRPTGVAVIGGGAIGAAMLGVVALGIAPGPAPTDRRPPVTRIDATLPASPATDRAPDRRTGTGVDPGLARLVGFGSVDSVPVSRMLP